MKRAIRPLLSALLLILTALGLHNVYADHSLVQEQAKGLACDACQPSLSQLGKSPISHQYFFSTPAGTVMVECKRPFVFVGSYECKRSGQ